MLSQSVLALPIDRLGPAPFGPGSMTIESVSPADFVKIEGDTVVKKEIKLTPPEVEMSEEQERKFAAYLDSELSSADSERWGQMEMFARLKLKYRTKFPEIPKDWPIANSSQITIPIIKLTVDTLTSRLFQTVMAAEPLHSVRTKNKVYQDFSVAYENFLDTYNKDRVDMEDKLDTIVTECIKLGTAVCEVTTKKDTRMVIKYDGLTNTYKREKRELFNGPIVYHFPIEDFWIRAGEQDPQTAPWCGKALRLTWSQIKDMAVTGDFVPESLKGFYNEVDVSPITDSPVQNVEAKIERREPMDWQKFTIFELSVRWDADGDGLDEEMIVYYHRESHTFLRKKFNTFKNGRRPWIVFRYKRIEHRFYGEGVAEMLEHLQEEISTIHNQRLDNATIANLHIILVARAIRGLMPGDRLWSGKIVKVNDVNKDVGTLRMGEIYPNTVTNENIAQSYAREVSGAGETATGQAQPVSRTTATAQLSLLEELNRRFDKTAKSFRKSIREIGIHETDLFAEFGTNGLASEWLGEEDGQLVDETLAEHVFNPRGCSIVVTSTKSTVNKEVEFQSAIAVMNLVVQMGEQFMTLAQQLAPQSVGELAHELVQAIKGPWKKVMQYSDPASADEALNVLAVLERVLPAPEDMGGMAGAKQAETNATAAEGSTGRGGGTATNNEGTSTTVENAQNQRNMEDMLASFRTDNGRRT